MREPSNHFGRLVTSNRATSSDPEGRAVCLLRLSVLAVASAICFATIGHRPRHVIETHDIADTVERVQRAQ